MRLRFAKKKKKRQQKQKKIKEKQQQQQQKVKQPLVAAEISFLLLSALSLAVSLA